MEQIYVTGHKNPDTDSIVSAMSYAALQHAVGERQYVAARLGHLSDETKLILERFGFEPPVYIKNAFTQVSDLEFDVLPVLNEAVTISRAWQTMQEGKISTLSIADDDGHLIGIVTAVDIANFDMHTMDDPSLKAVPLFNVLSVLEGQILTSMDCVQNAISGEIVIALPQSTGQPPYRTKDTVLICGDQPEMIRNAIDYGVKYIVLCQSELPEDIRNASHDTCVISTPYDGYTALRRIFQTIPVGRITKKDNIKFFHLSDYVDDVREVVLQNRYHSYPILDENDVVVGSLSRYHLLQPKRKQIVLVDHNEASQSIAGLEQADVLAIIDHHRLADIQTKNPVYFRNEPVGSTTTIVAGMYQERGLMPSPRLAGLMAAAIISDTVMFKSPTCTQRDRVMAERMANIAGIRVDELGQMIFSASTPVDKNADEMFMADFKEFHIAENTFGISQITCLDSDRHLKRKEEFLSLMADMKAKNGYNMILLMFTDVLLEGSKILYLGNEDEFRQAFNVELNDSVAFLPGIMSRKKQIVPMLSALWG